MEALQLLRSSAPDTFQLVLTVRGAWQPARLRAVLAPSPRPLFLPRLKPTLLPPLPAGRVHA